MQSYFLQRFPSLCFPRGKESIWQSERRGSVNNVGVAFAIIRFHDIEGLLLHRIGYRRKVYFFMYKSAEDDFKEKGKIKKEQITTNEN